MPPDPRGDLAAPLSSPFTVASSNVNGIRAAVRRGMREWLQQRRPDLICLQEVRAGDDELNDALGDGWYGGLAQSETRGRAGVAVFCRVPPVAVRVGLGTGEFAAAGRWIEADVELHGGRLTVVSVYAFTGEAGTPRQEQKYRFLNVAADRLRSLAASGGLVLACGDLNVAHREADLKNWKGNRGKSGFLAAERAWFDELLDRHGWVDVVRALSGEGPGPYSWWSWRGKAFDVDSGWRIDYQIASPSLGPLAVKAETDRAATYAERWSDHAPVVVTYDL